MDHDDIRSSDVGAHKIWVARQYPTYAPSSRIISNGFCSMGRALPGAISGKLVNPDRAANHAAYQRLRQLLAR